MAISMVFRPGKKSSRLVPAVAAVCLFAAGAVARASEPDFSHWFEQLRRLEGAWEGTFEWSGGRTGTGAAKAVYVVVGNGSAEVENLFIGADDHPSMTSVYHMDGSDLRMTHYCAAGNQPRLRATTIDERERAIHFSMVDATNLQVHPAHVNALDLRVVSDDHVVLRFTFDAGEHRYTEQIDLTRVTGDAPSSQKGRGDPSGLPSFR